MSYDNVGDFLAMGGYGVYVWGSYAVALVLMGAEVVGLWLRSRTVQEHLPRMGTLLPEEMGVPTH